VQTDLVMLHVVAVGVSLFGGGLMWWHHEAWARHQRDTTLEPGERLFFSGQYRRRMQASTMLLILGILLNASNEFLIPWQNFPLLFFVYICAMLGLVAWMVMLALGDFFATRSIHQAALARLREHQRQLEHTVGQMKNFKDQ
jgi:hypothetical protein